MSRNTRHRDDEPCFVVDNQTYPMAEKGASRPADPKVPAWEEMLEAIGEGLICFDPEGLCLYASPTASRLLSLLPNSLNQFFLCSLLPSWQKQSEEDRAKPQQIQWKRSQETRWLEVRCLLISSGIALHLRDVTEAKQNADALRRSEARFQSVISHLPVGFILGNENQAIARINEELHRMFHLSGTPDEAMARDCLSIAQEVSLQVAEPRGFLGDIEKIISRNESVHTARIQTKDHRHLEFDYIPISDSGEGLGHLWLFSDISDRVQTTTALRESEERFRAMSEASPFGMFVQDSTGNCTYVNPAFVRITGYSMEEMLGRGWEQFIHPEDMQSLLHQWTKHRDEIRSDFAYVFEGFHRAVRADGELRWCSVRVSLLRDEKGTPVGFVGTLEDITNRRAAEVALRESEERFRAISDAAPLGVFVEDMEGNCRYVNPEYARLVGYPASEMLGKGWMKRIHPDDWDRLHYEWPAAREQMQKRTDYVFDFPHDGVLPDGSVRKCHIRVTGLRNEVGGVVGYVGTLEDITDRLQREDALREREERLRAISESSPLGIYVEDADANCLYVNSTYERLVGLPSAEILGKGWQRLVAPEDMRRLNKMWPEARRQMAADPHFVFECNYRIILPNQKNRWCHTRVASMRDANGAVTGFVGAVEDVTHRQEAEQAMRDSEERYRALVEATSDCVWRVKASGDVLEISRALSTVSLGKKVLDPAALIPLIHPRDKKNVVVQWYHALATGEIMEQEFRIKGKRGGWVSVFARAVPLRDAEGNIREWVGTATDITAKRQAETERERLMQEALARAERDPLTELYNHRAFHQRLTELGTRIQGTSEALVVAVLDMDNFKYFNDVYGHLVGDDVLMTVARMLRKICRAEDTIARLGGDEFALLLPCPTADAAQATIDQLRDAAQALPYQPPGEPYPLPIRLSVGSAIYPLEGVLPVEAFTLADRRALLDKGGERYAPAREIAEHLKRTIEGFDMLDALVSSVDNKDRYTRRHSEDVLIYSQWIAEELGLSEEAITTLQVAALIHDVGKIGVPDRILRLPGRLSEADYQIMKRHVVLGSLLVSAVPGLEGTLDAVRHHHERWDGEGYPDNLRAEAIPFTARLMAVADAFSAMTTDRPYRKGLPPTAALTVLRQGAGTQWDAKMVAAMAKALEVRGHLLNQ